MLNQVILKNFFEKSFRKQLPFKLNVFHFRFQHWRNIFHIIVNLVWLLVEVSHWVLENIDLVEGKFFQFYLSFKKGVEDGWVLLLGKALSVMVHDSNLDIYFGLKVLDSHKVAILIICFMLSDTFFTKSDLTWAIPCDANRHKWKWMVFTQDLCLYILDCYHLIFLKKVFYSLFSYLIKGRTYKEKIPLKGIKLFLRYKINCILPSQITNKPSNYTISLIKR